ncbi:MAG TPA: ABC transporter substrate-binding protein [Stellaceae bacterium]
MRVGRIRSLAFGLLGLLLVCGSSRAAEAEAEATTRRIGILAAALFHPIDSFRQRLRELGWSEGQNVEFAYRWAEGDDARYPTLAAELVALKVDVIVTWGSSAALAAKEATRTIPIVMGAVGTALGSGVVPSLAHPGGNITGFSSQNLELAGKHVGLLKDLIPGIRRVGVLYAANPTALLGLGYAETAAKALGLTLDKVEIRNANDLETALPALTGMHPDAALVIADTLLLAERRRIVEFMTASRLPAIYAYPEFAEAGGLISYSPDFDDLFRQAAVYVDKILRGANPGDLSVQQASKFKLVVNLKTAEALGLTVPTLILGITDEVIE